MPRGKKVASKKEVAKKKKVAEKAMKSHPVQNGQRSMAYRYAIMFVHTNKKKKKLSPHWQSVVDEFSAIIQYDNDELGRIGGFVLIDSELSGYWAGDHINREQWKEDGMITGPYAHKIIDYKRFPKNCRPKVDGNQHVFCVKSDVYGAIINNPDVAEWIRNVHQVYKDCGGIWYIDDKSRIKAFSLNWPHYALVLSGVKDYENRKRRLILLGAESRRKKPDKKNVLIKGGTYQRDEREPWSENIFKRFTPSKFRGIETFKKADVLNNNEDIQNKNKHVEECNQDISYNGEFRGLLMFVCFFILCSYITDYCAFPLLVKPEFVHRSNQIM